MWCKAKRAAQHHELRKRQKPHLFLIRGNYTQQWVCQNQEKTQRDTSPINALTKFYNPA